MPIRRWRGWAAYCPDCGNAVMIGDEVVSYEHRDEVAESLDLAHLLSGETQDDRIRRACGCKRGAKK
mgnify:FL=1